MSAGVCFILCVQLEQLCSCKGNCMDVNAPWGPNGRTALHAAAEAGSAESLEVLLRAGADSYAADNGGASPLILAAAGGHAAAVKVRHFGAKCIFLPHPLMSEVIGSNFEVFGTWLQCSCCFVLSQLIVHRATMPPFLLDGKSS